MEEGEEQPPKPAWRKWLDRVAFVGWMLLWVGLFYYNSYVAMPDWTPVMYGVGGENEPIKLQNARSLAECRAAPIAFWRGVWASGGSIRDWEDLCMRPCWFLEDVIRPDAVRQISGRCHVVVVHDEPGAE